MNCCRNYFGLKRMLHQCIEKSRTFTFHFIVTITVIIIQNPIIVILNSFSLQILCFPFYVICSKNLNRMNYRLKYFGLKRVLRQCIEKSKTLKNPMYQGKHATFYYFPNVYSGTSILGGSSCAGKSIFPFESKK
jgi:hypothetical protein